jgi:predicted nucleotidyltransferase
VNRELILDRLNRESPRLKAKYRVVSLAVFGSFARGDDTEESDVDVLATFDGKPNFDNFMGLKLELEDLLGRPVDLLTSKCLSPAMEAEFRKESIVAP